MRSYLHTQKGGGGSKYPKSGICMLLQYKKNSFLYLVIWKILIVLFLGFNQGQLKLMMNLMEN